MMQEKRYTSEYIFHRQRDENWSSSKAGVQPGTWMLQCFNLQISCCLADSSATNQTVKIPFPERIRCLSSPSNEHTEHEVIYPGLEKPQNRTTVRDNKNLSLCSALNLLLKVGVQAQLTLSQNHTFLFSSPPTALSISVARSLSTEYENLLQTSMLPDLWQGFSHDCCTSHTTTHIKSCSPAPSPSAVTMQTEMPATGETEKGSP